MARPISRSAVAKDYMGRRIVGESKPIDLPEEKPDPLELVVAQLARLVAAMETKKEPQPAPVHVAAPVVHVPEIKVPDPQVILTNQWETIEATVTHRDRAGKIERVRIERVQQGP